MGRAEELFDRIKQRGAAEVHEMITAQVVEELFLDYKVSSTKLPARRLDDDDKKNLAKAISGFGNSEGGLIVWGVNCRQTSSGDVPSAAVPVSNPTALKTLFDGAVGGLTLPAHASVENFAALNSGAADGFVISYVPRGLSVPYQTVVPKEEYYIRAGSSFQPTPHGVLAGMFGRAPQPIVAPLITFGGGQVVQNVPPSIRLMLQVFLVNQGRGLAEDIFCIVEGDLPSGSTLNFSVNAVERHWNTTRSGRSSFTAIIGSNTILPPGAELQVFTVVLNVNEAGKGDHSVTISSGSRNGPGSAVTVRLPGRIIDEAFAHYTCRYDTVAMREAAERHYAAQLKTCFPQL